VGDNKVRTKVILVRHGECKGNREGLFRGRSDFPLNEQGLIQAKELAIEMKQYNPFRIFTGPLSRARQTALIIGRECHTEIEIREGINNIELGPWEGQAKQVIAREYPEQWEIWLNKPEKLSVPGIETLQQVQKRARKELDRIVKDFNGKTVIIVSHRAVLKPLIASCLKISKPYFWRIHIDTAAYSILHYKKGLGYTLVQLNQNRHLSEFISEWV
jgi:broad specificity phosphatase PhoE